MYKNDKLSLDTTFNQTGRFVWRVPSNIALVKYWGKYGNQLPQNPSVSLTLNNAYTETAISYGPKKSDETIDLTFLFEGQQNEVFKLKIVKYLDKLTAIYPFIKQLSLTIESKNSFPHSSGIASSASSMASIALGLVSIEEAIFGTGLSTEDFNAKSSFIARLGSGSACRSIFPVASVWGTTSKIERASNEYGIGIAEKVHERFKNFHNDILIISSDKKSVSSTIGHQLMEGNHYAESRFKEARLHLSIMIDCLESGDLETYIKIVEKEALTLHALMMTSSPSFILMKPNSLKAIEKIRNFRNKTGLPVCFTLDAGPNIHLMYPDEIKKEIQAFIKEELSPLCENGLIIEDQLGMGPTKLENNHIIK